MLDIQNGTERDDLGVVKGITLLPSVLQARLTGRRGGRSFVVDFGGRFFAFRWILFALFRISEPESSSLKKKKLLLLLLLANSVSLVVCDRG